MNFLKYLMVGAGIVISAPTLAIDIGECLTVGSCEESYYENSYPSESTWWEPMFSTIDCPVRDETVIRDCNDPFAGEFVSNSLGINIYKQTGGHLDGNDYYIYNTMSLPSDRVLKIIERYTDISGNVNRPQEYMQSKNHKILKLPSGKNRPDGTYQYSFYACEKQGCRCNKLKVPSVLAKVDHNGVSFSGGALDELYSNQGYMIGGSDYVSGSLRKVKAPVVTKLFPPNSVSSHKEALKNIAFLAAPYGNNFGDICEGLPQTEQADCRSCIQNSTNSVDQLYCVVPKTLKNELQNNNVTLAITAFDGINKIEDKSRAYQKTIKHIQNIRNQNFAPAELNPFVMLGLSLGGVVARDALVGLEEEGHKHEVKWYVSIDAPHRGAYVPLGFQRSLTFISEATTAAANDLKGELIKFIDSAHGILKGARDELNAESVNSKALYANYFGTDTTKELLLEHVGAANGKQHSLFASAQTRMGNKMPACTDRNIAVINGAVNGNRYSPPSTYFHYDAYIDSGNGNKDPRLQLHVRNPQNNNQYFWGRLDYVDGKDWDGSRDWKHYERGNGWANTGIAYDSMPCSTTSIADTMWGELEDKTKTSYIERYCVRRGLRGVCVEYAHREIAVPFTIAPMTTNGLPKNCFIPTFSAAGLKPSYYGNGSSSSDNRYRSINQNHTIFDRTTDWILGGNSNQSHFSFDNISPLFGYGTDINGSGTASVFDEVYQNGGLSNGPSKMPLCQ